MKDTLFKLPIMPTLDIIICQDGYAEDWPEGNPKRLKFKYNIIWLKCCYYKFIADI